MIPHAGKEPGPPGGPVPDRGRPGPRLGILRLVIGALAILAGLSLPVLAAAPAQAAAPTPNAYVTNFNSTTVSVIDTATNTITATIPVSNGPIGVAIGTPPFPSLTVTKTHRGAFVQGKRNTYRITVTNHGTGPTDATTVTVTDTLPTGLTPVSLRGTGWACTRATLTCTRSDTLAPGRSYPTIKLTVKASYGAPKQVTNTATVTGGGSTPATATDPTTIKRGKHCGKHHHRHHHGRHHKKHRPGKHDARHGVPSKQQPHHG
ncbi:hypothetical protein [Streptomyces mirabilis]|uniref:hypothetical protein n=1 Tax=Streptomyces mirabilis TaxID=68239 RepID=UPI0033B900B2